MLSLGTADLNLAEIYGGVDLSWARALRNDEALCKLVRDAEEDEDNRLITLGKPRRGVSGQGRRCSISAQRQKTRYQFGLNGVWGYYRFMLHVRSEA